jgi:hypothetical protein
MIRRHRPATIVGVLAAIAVCLAPSISNAASVWEIDTYGNGAMLTAVFRGIALFASSGGGMISALKLAALVGLIILLVSATAAVLTSNHATLLFPYAAIVAGVVSSLSTVSVPVAVVDKLVASSVVIDGVPLPIAIAGYFSSTLGSRIVDRVEQAMMPVDAERFMTHGLGWGPRVMQATLDARIQDPILLHDLNTYIEVCVSEAFNTGYKTATDLSHGTTADQILGDTNPAIPFVLPSQTNPPDNQTCPDAWNNVLNPKFTEHATSQGLLGTLALRLGLPSYTGVTSAIDDIMPTYQISQSAVELLRERFAVNQLLPALQAMSALGNQSGMVTAWALAEAQAQQTSSWLTAGLLLQQTLPVFYSALEFLFYGFMVVGVPMLMVMPRLLLSILQTALFIQLWPLAYVFGNLFLYTQVARLAFFTGDSNQGLGLSLAATQPLNEGIQNAYAASGFPILIGILILSGMIYGGGYAIQRSILTGPWTAGGAFGTASALGNMSFGNVSHDNLSSGNIAERTLARHTVAERVVNQDNFTARTQTFGTSGGTVSLSQGRDGAIGNQELASSFGTIRFDPRTGGAAMLGSSPLTMQTATQATAEGGNALNIENAKVQQRANEVQHAQASNLAKSYAVTTSADQSRQHGISEGTRQAFQEAASHEITKGLQSGDVGREIHGHSLTRGGSASAGLEGQTPKLLGFSIGGGGRIDVRSQFQNGEEFTTTLSKETSDRVLSQAHQSLERGTEYRQLNEETTRHGEDSRHALGFDDVHRSTESYNEAVSKRESAAATLRAVQAFSASVGVNRGHEFINALWEARNPGVNFAQAVREDRPSAASFSAELAAAAQNPAKLEELSKEALGHLEKTGQLAQYTGASAAIESQRPAAPSAQPLAPPANPLTGSGYQAPTPPQHGTITGRVDRELQQTGAKLAPEQQALSTQVYQLEQLSGQQLELGIDKRRAETEGGAFTAGKEAVGEVLSGPAALANSLIKGIQEKKPDEQGGNQPPKAQ